MAAITLSVTSINGVAPANSLQALPINRIVSFTGAGNSTLGAATLIVESIEGRAQGAVPKYDTWVVTQTYAAVLSAIIAANTAMGGAPLASPTFTGTPAAPTATSGTNTTQIATTAFVQDRKTPNGTASGTNTYAVTISPAITVAAGALICVRFTNASTGSSTLNVNSGGAVNLVKKNGSTAVGNGDIAANTWYTLLHDGTSWVALNI